MSKKIDPAISRILDEARTAIVTVGNINDVANFCVKYGLGESYTDIINKALEEYGEGQRMLLVYDKNAAEGADNVIETDLGKVSVKRM